MKKPKRIGIDLGTCFSEIVVISESGAVVIIPNSDGDLKTRSIVSWASGVPIAGRAACPDLILAPQYVVQWGKRYISQASENHKPIPIITDPSGREITAVDFSAAILSYLKKSAEDHLGSDVEDAVITVPAYFDRTARDNTKAAARIAGFGKVKLLDEPEAAAIFDGLEKGRNETVVIVDTGGGTTDVTAMDIGGMSITAIVTDGDSELGGSNYTEAIFEMMCERAKAEGIEISAEKDMATFYQNLDRARDAKEILSRRNKVMLVAEADGKRVPIEFTQKMLRNVGQPFDERFVSCCQRLLDELNNRGKRIDRVLLVGGNSRQPHVATMVEKVFGMEPSKNTDPDLVVAKGAAVWAEVCFGDKDHAICVGGHHYLASEINMKTVSAHAICVAAIRDKSDPEERNCIIVPANTSLPHDFEERFSPVNPGSSEVTVKIVQGKEGELSKNCPLLRKFTVPIQPSGNDEDRIRLKGRYTEEGLLELTVVDDLLGKPVSDSFIHKTGLSEDEINQKRKQLRKDMKCAK